MDSDARSRIRVGEIFKYGLSDESGYRDFYKLTKGRHATGVGSGGKGIFHYARIEKDGRVPAIILHSNPFMEGTEKTPWIDDINIDQGYAIYNGDNKASGRDATESAGNKILIEVLNLYQNPDTRILAPPILLFKQELIKGKRKGYRSFQGYGIPLRAFTRVQKEYGSSNYYTNLVFEVILMSLSNENEEFDWRWIDDRRDPTLTSNESLRHAPRTWKSWVEGRMSIDSPEARHTAARSKIMPLKLQRDYSDRERRLLQEIYLYYGGNSNNSKRHLFEALASVVAQKVIGHSYHGGWITKRGGDGGIDFVGRLDVGISGAKTSAVVLGQAKCVDPISSSISGLQLSRVAARLRRGWIGVFVTTGAFSVAAQHELLADQYPIVLINGQTLAREVLKILNAEKIPLKEFLDNVSSKYDIGPQMIDADRIVDWEFPSPLTEE